MATRFDDELAAILAGLEASGKGFDSYIEPLMAMPTASPEEEEKKRGVLATLSEALHAPKRGVDQILNYAVGGDLRRRMLLDEDPVPAGELAKAAYVGPIEPGQDHQQLRGVARAGMGFLVDSATDPVAVAAIAASAAFPPAAPLINAGFTGLMLKGAYEAGDAAYESYRREGWSGTTAEKAAEAVISGGMAALGVRDVAKTIRGRRGATGEQPDGGEGGEPTPPGEGLQRLGPGDVAGRPGREPIEAHRIYPRRPIAGPERRITTSEPAVEPGRKLLPPGPEDGGGGPPAPEMPPPPRRLESLNLPGDPVQISDDALLSTLRGFDGAIADAVNNRDLGRATELRRHRSKLQDLYRARKYDPSVQIGRSGDLLQLRDMLHQERARGVGVKRGMEIAESLQVIDAELNHLRSSEPIVPAAGEPAPPTFTERTPRALPPAPAEAAPPTMPQAGPQGEAPTVSPTEPATGAQGRLEAQRPAVQELLERGRAEAQGIAAPERPEIAKVIEGGAPPEVRPAAPAAPVAAPVAVAPEIRPAPAAPAPPASVEVPAAAPSLAPERAGPVRSTDSGDAASLKKMSDAGLRRVRRLMPEDTIGRRELDAEIERRSSPAPAPPPGRRLTPKLASKKRAAGPISAIEMDGQPYWSNNHMVLRGKAPKGAIARKLDPKRFHEATDADVPAQPMGLQTETSGYTKVGGETVAGRQPVIWMKAEIRNGKKVYVPVDPDYYRTLEDAGPGRWAVDRKGSRLTRYDPKGAIVGSVARLNGMGDPPEDLEPMGVAEEPQLTGDAEALRRWEEAVAANTSRVRVKTTVKGKTSYRLEDRVAWAKVPEPPKDEMGSRILPGQVEWTPERRKLVHAAAEAEARQVAQAQENEPVGRHAILDEEGKTDYGTAREGGSNRGGYVVNSHKSGTALEDVAAGPKEIVEKLGQDKGNDVELEVHQKVDGWNQEYAVNHAAEVQGDPLWSAAYPEEIARGLAQPSPPAPPVERGIERRVGGSPVAMDRRVTERRKTVATEVGLPENHPAVIRAADAEIAARTDKLTGLGNKAHWDEVLETVAESDHVAVLDLKKFKGINDTLGHAAGDAVLQRVATVLDEHFDGDSARFGGDEFGGVLRGVSLDEARSKMESVREELAASVVDVLDPTGKQVAVQGIEAHIGVGRNAREADLAANAVAAESRKGGRGEIPRLAPADAGAPGPGVEGLPDRGRAGAGPAEGEVARRPIYEKTPLGDQALIPGTLDAAATMPVPKPAETFSDSPLFRQDEAAAARAEEAAFQKAQTPLPIEAIQVALEDQGLTPGQLGEWDQTADKPGSLVAGPGANARLKAWVEVRNAARWMAASVETVGTAGSKAAIQKASSAAEAFVHKYGPLHEATTFRSDPDWELTASLENYTPPSHKGPHKIAPIRRAVATPADLSAVTPEVLGGRLAEEFATESAGGEGGAKKPPAGPPKPGAPEIEPEPSKWRKTVNAAKARTRARGKGGQANVGVDPQAAADIAIEGADYAFRGARKFGTWAEVMMRGLGHFVAGLREMLYGIWNAIRGLFRPTPKPTETARAQERMRQAQQPETGGTEGGERRTKIPKRPRYAWEENINAEDARAAADAGARMGEAPEPKYGKPGGDPDADINFERVSDEGGIREWQARAAEAYKAKFGGSREARTWKEAESWAREAGINEADVLRQIKKNGAVTQEWILAGRDLRQTAAKIAAGKLNEIGHLKEALKSATDPLSQQRLREQILEAEREYYAATAKWGAISAATVEAGSEAGRALRAHAKMTESLSPEELWMRKLMRRAPGLTPEQTAALADAALNHDAAKLMELSREVYKPRFIDYIMEFTNASILSGPGTLGVNGAGNVTFEALFRTPERGLSAFLDKGPRQWLEKAFGRKPVASERESREMLEAIRAHMQVKFGLPKILKLGWEALRHENPMTAGAMKGELHPTAFPGLLGKVIRTPFRLLQAMDMGARSAAMDAEAAAQAIRMAMAEAHKAGGWTPEKVTARMEQIKTDYQKYVELEGQKRSGEVLSKEANEFRASHPEYGRMLDKVEKSGAEAVFQDPLDKFSRALLSMRSAHPWMGLFVRFVHTPSRLLAQAIRRSPYGIYDVIRKARSGELQGGELSDRMAQVVWGNAIGAGLYLLARQGFITGSGPSDPDEARVWKDSGKLPYSVRIPFTDGPRWVSLARLDPVSTTLGWAADLAEAQDQPNAGKAYEKLIQSLMQNVVNKTYLQSLTGLTEAISDPDRAGPALLKQLAGSFVPNILASAARAIDPTVRETPDIASTLLSRIPIASTYLPARHKGTGEIVTRGEDPISRFASPFRYSQELGPEGNLERIMLSTGYIPQAPPKQLTIPGTLGRKVDLTPDERALYASFAERATAYARTLATEDSFVTLDPIMQEEVLKRIYRFAHDRAHQALIGAVANRIGGSR